MKVYKEKQFLMFDFEDGSMVKYDFATKKSIGKRGMPVKDLCSQLRGYTLKTIIESCVDQNYGKFLSYIQVRELNRGHMISNIGTILDRVPYYANYEQLFSAGVRCSGKINKITNIPTGLIRICRNYDIAVTDNLIDNYNISPDIFHCVMETECTSLSKEDKIFLLGDVRYVERTYQWPLKYLCVKLGTTVKTLLRYFDYLSTYEAIDIKYRFFGEYLDYISMVSSIADKYEKFPRHFLTTHQITARNYNRLKLIFDEEKFSKIRKPEMECKFGDYVFIYPHSTQEIKDEAVQQSNCVASYINRVLEGQCDILFLRKEDAPDKALVTIEVRDGRIVQARQHYNYTVTAEQRDVIDKWDARYAKLLDAKAA